MILEQFEATIEHARVDHSPEGNLNTVACERIALHYLRRIRDEHLYPDETFKAYLQRRWGITTMIDHEETDRIADSPAAPERPDHHQPAVVLGLDPAAPGAESTVVARQDLSRQIADQQKARHLRKLQKKLRRNERRDLKALAYIERWKRRFPKTAMRWTLVLASNQSGSARRHSLRRRQIQVVSSASAEIGDMICRRSGKREVLTLKVMMPIPEWLRVTVIRKATK